MGKKTVQEHHDQTSGRGLKTDATPQEKAPKMKKAAPNPVRDVNKMKPKQFRPMSAIHKHHRSKDTKFSGSMRKYSREYVGNASRNGMCDHTKGTQKFRRDFDANGEIGPQAASGAVKMKARFFPGHNASYTAGFDNHPSKVKVAH